MAENKSEWGRKHDELLAVWPKNEDGTLEPSAFLCTCDNVSLNDELTVNLLEAYSIPCVRDYPGIGAFGRIIMGASATGVDIYVPESMLEEAKRLLEGENIDEEL